LLIDETLKKLEDGKVDWAEKQEEINRLNENIKRIEAESNDWKIRCEERRKEQKSEIEEGNMRLL
jgi:hypothetical protein